jgi:hypothetical protein
VQPDGDGATSRHFEFPEEHARGPHRKMAGSVQLLIGAGGIYGAFIYYGVLQVSWMTFPPFTCQATRISPCQTMLSVLSLSRVTMKVTEPGTFGNSSVHCTPDDVVSPKPTRHRWVLLVHIGSCYFMPGSNLILSVLHRPAHLYDPAHIRITHPHAQTQPRTSRPDPVHPNPHTRTSEPTHPDPHARTPGSTHPHNRTHTPAHPNPHTRTSEPTHPDPHALTSGPTHPHTRTHTPAHPNPHTCTPKT